MALALEEVGDVFATPLCEVKGMITAMRDTTHRVPLITVFE